MVWFCWRYHLFVFNVGDLIIIRTKKSWCITGISSGEHQQRGETWDSSYFKINHCKCWPKFVCSALQSSVASSVKLHSSKFCLWVVPISTVHFFPAYYFTWGGTGLPMKADGSSFFIKIAQRGLQLGFELQQGKSIKTLFSYCGFTLFYVPIHVFIL